MNLYGYVLSDPVNRVDPFGLEDNCTNPQPDGGCSDVVVTGRKSRSIWDWFDFGRPPALIDNFGLMYRLLNGLEANDQNELLAVCRSLQNLPDGGRIRLGSDFAAIWGIGIRFGVGMSADRTGAIFAESNIGGGLGFARSVSVLDLSEVMTYGDPWSGTRVSLSANGGVGHGFGSVGAQGVLGSIDENGNLGGAEISVSGGLDNSPGMPSLPKTGFELSVTINVEGSLQVGQLACPNSR